MLPDRQPPLQATPRRLPAIRSGTAIALAIALAWPTLAAAQDEPADEDKTAPQDPLAARPAENEAFPAPAPEFNAASERQIAFEADTIAYDNDGDTVTASGDVLLRSGDQSVRADAVTWSQMTGEIVATGSVRLVDEDGNQLFTDRLTLTEELKAGAMENLLLALRAGGRLAAEQGVRDDAGNVVLSRAAYSGCAVTSEEGCPKDPSWRITAERVTYNAEAKTIRFKGAFLEVFGVRVLPLLALSLRTDGGAKSGFMVPDFGYSSSNGLEAGEAFYLRLADNRDLEIAARIYSLTAPMVSARYRALTSTGAYQITGYGTFGSRLPIGATTPTEQNDFRGYFAANGRFQLDPFWSLSSSARVATDRTFLRRYDISRDDRLRSTVNLERIDDDSYFSLSGWATQVLLTKQSQGQVPIAVPVIDYRRRLSDPLLGGTVELQANTLAIARTSGQDTQRGFAGAKWDLRRVTSLGQELTLTALLRGDVYHSDENALSRTALYRGTPGWEARGVVIGAVDLKWPFVGELLGGTQVFTPRLQFVASPEIRNLAIPNEDARAIDLEDSNLFALNRFPGYDRVEDGVRVTYGADWSLDRPGWRIRSTIGQSYRLSDKPTLFPDGTGLNEQWSDFVGRTEVRYRDFISLTHRFRLDKDNLAVRRNEIDMTLGSDSTYLEVGYLRLNRNIDLTFEDLQDREELRVATRIAFARYWSMFGSAVVNLTDRREDPNLTSDGFEPLRTRLGIAYSDDCLEFGVTWRRDYVTIADARLGNSFAVFFSLKNLGLQ
ncbi:LPS assembly protein LptD [Altererythrobacter salegens]|uniref:LPS-assembly protein LptD n=1 Tax=Croceibacterium salegens TaxID=1737568 RepID=A0A6I4STQ3_9SPHN|nr:LPS assembly protein LptD [Croceibacterium salegens]MXO58300.1 LPS assembly protein LptD [Croceibacterium salegens]